MRVSSEVRRRSPNRFPSAERASGFIRKVYHASVPTLDRIRSQGVWSGHPLPVPPAKRLFRARRIVWKGIPWHLRGLRLSRNGEAQGSERSLRSDLSKSFPTGTSTPISPGTQQRPCYTARATTTSTPHCLRRNITARAGHLSQPAPSNKLLGRQIFIWRQI